MKAVISPTAVLLILVLSTVAVAREDYLRCRPNPLLQPGMVSRKIASQHARVVFYEDMERVSPGWTTSDATNSERPKFHKSSYGADPIGGGTSWWCGEQSARFATPPGYGNNWIQHLYLPEITVDRDAEPALSLRHMYDVEENSDFVLVEAFKNGSWSVVGDLVFTGTSGGWKTVCPEGYRLGGYVGYDGILRLRITFQSDAAWSDEDGFTDTYGGYFADNIRIFDIQTEEVYLLDNNETSCRPAAPEAAGNYWHVSDRKLAAYSGTRSWWCGSDADSSSLPSGLRNELISPSVSLRGLECCTLLMIGSCHLPAGSGAHFVESVSIDGGITWHTIYTWSGDFAVRREWFLHKISLDWTLGFGDELKWKLTVITPDQELAGTTTGIAGVFIDDTWVESCALEPGEESSSWGKIKSMYR